MHEIINYFTIKLQYSDDINKTKIHFTLLTTVILAIIPHIFLAGYYFSTHIYVMSLINIISCTIYSCTFILNKFGKFRLVSIVTTLEIIIYSVLSTFFLGSNIDSHWFILTVIIPQFTLFDVSTKQRTVLILFAFIALNVCTFIHLLYSPMFPQDGNIFLNTFHLNIVFIAIILELTFNIFLNKIMTKSNTSKIEQYKELAHIDPLTKLKNRRYAQLYFDDMVHDGIYTNTVCFALLDIDHFKVINDTYGHDVGDKILVRLSERLVNTFRQGDLIARWGGEEFLIVMKDCDIQIAKTLLENLRIKIANDKFELNETGSVKMNFTVTIGVAELVDLSIDDAILKCDHNLYIGKNEGRNKVII